MEETTIRIPVEEMLLDRCIELLSAALPEEKMSSDSVRGKLKELDRLRRVFLGRYGSEGVKINMHPMAAGTNDVGIFCEPTNALLEFASTLTTLDREHLGSAGHAR